MKRIYTIITALFIWLTISGEGWGQTTVFVDDFSTEQNAAWTTSGAIGSSSWSVTRSGADWGARRNTSPEQLELTNDVGATANVNGWVFANVSTSGFTAPYNTTLNSNTGIVTWTFNMRQIRTDPAGFASGSYGVAFILAGSSQTANNTGSGYAVVLGQSGSTDPLRLAKYNNGLAGTVTNILTSNTSGLTDFGAEYLSIKVTYNPSTDTWELFLRNDGSSAFADPSAGSLTSQGTAVDDAYTDIALSYMGGWWQGSTGANQTAFFDNVKVTVTEAGTPLITVNPSSLTGFSYIQGSGPSSEQSFSISGSNLTDDISITPSTNHEISTGTGGSFSATNPITLNQSGGTVDATTIYVRLKAGLDAGNYNTESITASSTDADNKTVTCSGTVYKTEPTNHVTDFTTSAGTPTHSAINLSWTDASDGVIPDGYLIKGSSTSYAAIIDPVDGTAESDGALVKKVDHGSGGTASITGLTENTTYYFKIFPYTNSGANINYKTDGSIPQASRTTAEAPPASLLLEENFNYGVDNHPDLLDATGNWTRHGGAAGPAYSNSSLTYTDYASSGVGGSVSFTFGSSGVNDGDVNRTFTAVTTTSVVYVSLLLNLSAAASTADYFFHLGPQAIGSIFRGRVFARSNGAGWSLGLSKSSETRVDDNTELNFNQTYLLVLKYSFNTTTTSDDLVTLYVYQSGVPATEPGTPLVSIGPVGAGTGSDPVDIGSIAIRQGSNTPTGTIDGIRISDGWGQAPLPVELSSFVASAAPGNVQLSWQTATEINNYGFEIERSIVNVGQTNSLSTWDKIGFVAGHGNSNSTKDYSFTDNSISTSGNYAYRLKQIDNDGSFSYSQVVETDVTVNLTYSLGQNYPNPFNPTTKISYTLPETGLVTLKVYNIVGETVAELINQTQEAGKYEVEFSANGLSNGVYFYELKANGFTSVKKLMLLK